ncbi:MAG: TrkA family potassium uptake protein [Clostridiales bacterium]|jgi:trk system potassium uptake protein TrkA|nr:TrkA family potassium uptake protein [Clostridiales bacterium]MDR2749319.1 TrkA family potassium uptake protein [Clostridiales bacterium]
MKKGNKPKQFAVLGLGRFGMSVAIELSRLGAEVLACDTSEEKLRMVTEHATHVIKMDAGNEEALEKLELSSFDVVILAMGEDFQASALAVLTAKELGAKKIVVKASGEREKRVLESLGADMVLIPEQEMGRKIAHKLMKPNILDLLENEGRVQVNEMRPMEEWIGKTVAEADIRKKHGISLLCVLRGEKTIVPVNPGETILAGDVLVALSNKA